MITGLVRHVSVFLIVFSAFIVGWGYGHASGAGGYSGSSSAAVVFGGIVFFLGCLLYVGEEAYGWSKSRRELRMTKQ